MRLATTIFVALAFAPTTDSSVHRARYLMGTVCEVAVASEADAERVFAEAERIEAFLSNFREDSELSRMNRGEVEPGPELRALLDVAMEWARKTKRAFEPRWNNAIDPGAFGKGYALDRMLALLPGDALLNFGGQILVRGSHAVTIADPKNREQPILELTLTNASLSTSSNNERAHIVDPRSGKPVKAWGSVSVIADDALTADILSTALYVMGEDDGLRWADAHGVAAIFITNDQRIRMSAPARVRHFRTKD